jgi:hypothetical protein
MKTMRSAASAIVSCLTSGPTIPMAMAETERGADRPQYDHRAEEADGERGPAAHDSFLLSAAAGFSCMATAVLTECA